MYLFMDVLFNQPRNAGSSTSLTTSIALVLNFHNIKSISCCFHFFSFFNTCMARHCRWFHWVISILTYFHSFIMDRAKPLVETLTLGELLQLLIFIVNRIQALTYQTPPPVTPPAQPPLRAPFVCEFHCQLCQAPCNRNKAGHSHHRCGLHRNL